LEIFAAELRSRPKSGQIVHVFGPRNFFGVCPPQKILDRHYKIGPSTDHCAKFHAGRPTHLGDLALTKKTSGLKHKFSRKLSFPGGLTNSKIKHTQTFKCVMSEQQHHTTHIYTTTQAHHPLTNECLNECVDFNVPPDTV